MKKILLYLVPLFVTQVFGQIPMGMLKDTTVQGPVKHIYETIYKSGDSTIIGYENEYQFDENGNFVQKKASSQGEPMKLRIKLFYDNNLLVKKEFYSRITGEISTNWVYKYNEDGNLVYEDDGMFKKEWKYDDKGRVIEKKVGKQVTTFDYDDKESKMTESVESKFKNGVQKITYFDKDGRKIKVDYPNWGEEKECEVIYTYTEDTKTEKDKCRNVTSIQQYDDHGRLLREEETRTKDGKESRKLHINKYNEYGQKTYKLSDYGEKGWETKYVYHYDEYGNFTSVTSYSRDKGKEDYELGISLKRNITYYK